MICGSYAYYNICFADSEEGGKRELVLVEFFS